MTEVQNVDQHKMWTNLHGRRMGVAGGGAPPSYCLRIYDLNPHLVFCS